MSELMEADDPMLGCMLLLNRALQLPLEGQSVTLPLLCAAATRAGLSIHLVARDLDEIPDTSLPAILLLGKTRPCVLLQRCEHGRYVIALSGWNGGVQKVCREELLAQSRGHAIFALPAFSPPVSTDMKLVQPYPSPGTMLRAVMVAPLREAAGLDAQSTMPVQQASR
ncbi:cysteine peptidase family C39 domain-containing protein [Cupriavidus sp. H39]|uniref:cysteine peptidase family C39 domain-containing protein n=1 Tax=Cupriavidus sp. H39 TaxID=3401635 RepID=UPI003CFF5CC1